MSPQKNRASLRLRVLEVKGLQKARCRLVSLLGHNFTTVVATIHRCDHQIFGVVASAEMPGEMVRKILYDSCPLRIASSGCWCLARLHFEDIPAEILQSHCSGWCVCLCLCSLVDGLKTEKKVLNYVTVHLICLHCFAAWQEWCECERLIVRGNV